MILQQKRTEKEILIEHFTTGGKAEQLPPKLLDEWYKIDVAHNLLKLHKLSAAVDLFIVHYREKDLSISQATAYRYMALAQSVWGAMPIMNKEYWRQIMFEGAQDDHAFAKLRKDVAGMNDARKNMVKILRLDKDDEKEIDPAKIQQHNNVIIIIGGKEDLPKSLSVKEFETYSPEEKEKYISMFYDALTPQDISFIDIKNDSE